MGVVDAFEVVQIQVKHPEYPPLFNESVRVQKETDPVPQPGQPIKIGQIVQVRIVLKALHQIIYKQIALHCVRHKQQQRGHPQ